MRLDDLPESGNVEDRRGEGGFGGGGGFGIPMGGGGIGIGTIVVLGIIGWALGIDPSLLIGGAEVLSGSGHQQTQAPPTARRTSSPQDEMGRFVNRVLGSTEARWKEIFAKDGRTYRPPVLVLYRGRTEARCGGAAQAAMGPFYCPNRPESLSGHVILRSDRDALSWLRCRQQIVPVFRGLRDCARDRASRAEPARHPFQGAARAAGCRQRAEANQIQVRVELQADCLAGVWARTISDKSGKQPFIEPGDVEAALRTAAAIGDDTLQQPLAGLCCAGQFYPWQLGAAPALVRYRISLRHGAELQYVRLRAAVSGAGARDRPEQAIHSAQASRC